MVIQRETARQHIDVNMQQLLLDTNELLLRIPDIIDDDDNEVRSPFTYILCSK